MRPTDERQALGEVFEEMGALAHAMLLAEGETNSSKSYVDTRHPLTVRAHAEMASLLTSTGAAERLILDNPFDFFGEERRIDEATTYSLALTPKLYGPGIGKSSTAGRREKTDPSQYGLHFEQSLAISYRGLIFIGKGGRLLRGSQYIHIASRSEDDASVWLPDLGIINIQEWQLLSNTPRVLQEYRRHDPIPIFLPNSVP